MDNSTLSNDALYVYSSTVSLIKEHSKQKDGGKANSKTQGDFLAILRSPP